ncbi:LytTR family DNA-binding domain-containing protein [uncultured Eudoraea sp.]|uniref:LytR/AlgR family response regulator transcription factor n=1 Tax=uncultured Eudoraea sp. TaxID=1035614 RepID=UPI002636F892|nr:LytTR family DNA-binding domain-containing protein [uncultured Eudoraea sp.]
MRDSPLNTLVVENSKVHCKIIARMVQNHDDLNLVTGCSNAIDANRIIKNNKIDLILLDIEMPFIDGFDLLESLDQKIQVIIISGNSNNALKAFDYGVTDFLLKPLNSDRFDHAVRKVLSNNRRNVVEEDKETFTVRSNLKNKQLNIKEVKWIEALGDYVKIITDNEKVIALSTMKSISDKLPNDRFLRIHRSYIVNLNKVDKFDCTSVEIDKHQIPMSRKQKPKLEFLLEKFDS